jgi:ribosomal protein S18 acetylase RimI-like enzyme
MKLVIRQLTNASEVLELAPYFDRVAAESMAEFRDDALPADVIKRFVEREFGERQTTFMVAETEAGERCGACVTGPLRDPLLGETIPLIVILEVDPQYRHRGVARALVQETSAVLVGRGEQTLAARAAHNDDALISMGERWGFVRQWELLVLD